MTRALLTGILALLLTACGANAVPGQWNTDGARPSATGPSAIGPSATGPGKSKPPGKRVVAGPVQVDPSFRYAGNDEQMYLDALLPRPDGRLLIAGSKLFQVLDDGMLDATFTAFDLQDTGAEPKALDASGRVYVVRSGKVTSALLRLQANGALDPSFGTQGSVTLGFHLRDVRVTPNGLLLTGSAWDWADGGAQARLVISRLNAQGHKDRRFAGGGFHLLPWPRSRGERLELLSNGQFIVAGSADDEPVVLRFNHDGSLDRNFGQAGLARIGPKPCARLFRTLSVAPSGTIYAAGDLHRHVIARFTRNGRLDHRFAGTGFTCFDYSFEESSSETNFAEITGLEAQADDSVIVSGRAMEYVGALRGLQRFDANGRRDRSFDVDNSVAGIALDARGRLLVLYVKQGVQRLLPR